MNGRQKVPRRFKLALRPVEAREPNRGAELERSRLLITRDRQGAQESALGGVDMIARSQQQELGMQPVQLGVQPMLSGLLVFHELVLQSREGALDIAAQTLRSRQEILIER